MRGKGIHSKSIFVQLIVFSLLTSLVPILIISIFLPYFVFAYLDLIFASI